MLFQNPGEERLSRSISMRIQPDNALDHCCVLKLILNEELIPHEPHRPAAERLIPIVERIIQIKEDSRYLLGHVTISLQRAPSSGGLIALRIAGLDQTSRARFTAKQIVGNSAPTHQLPTESST
jgi:hypothetical protein